MMKRIICAAAISALMFSMPIMAAGDGSYMTPEYSGAGTVGKDGLTGGYTYEFRDGKLSPDISEALLLVNGEFVPGSVIIRNSRSLVPVEFIAKAFGVDTTWDEAERTIAISGGKLIIVMTIGEDQILVNGELLKLDAPPVLYNGQTYVPLRSIAEAMGKSVGFIPNGVFSPSEYLGAKSEKLGIAYNAVVWVDDADKTASSSGNTDGIRAALVEKQLAALGISEIGKASAEYAQIKAAIENTRYVGNAGRYALFKGPYMTLVDTTAPGLLAYYYKIAHMLGGISEADFESPQLFSPMYVNN